MSITLRSFAKINLGLRIGPVRADGFHELRTIYQTIALHDLVTVEVEGGSGIEIVCTDERVPRDESNTCYRIAERILAAISGQATGEPQSSRLDALIPDDKERAGRIAGERGYKVVITIEKRLPVQGGMGAASSNAVATMMALERVLGVQLAPAERQRIAAEVGSDLPLFLIGGTVLGVGRGEEVSPLPDLPVMPLVVVTPPVGVSTPRAFARWDEYVAHRDSPAGDWMNFSASGAPGVVAPDTGLVNPATTSTSSSAALTASDAAGTINEFSKSVLSLLSERAYPQAGPASGVPARGGDRAETPLLDLVRAGIENDFEQVVFSEYPDLCEVKRVLQREDARYASLSGSGATLYGVFATAEEAEAAAARMRAAGHAAVATRSLTRDEYWEQMWRE